MALQVGQRLLPRCSNADGRQTAESPERAQAEQAMLMSEATFRFVFQSNPQSMWICDLPTLRFLEVNDAAVERYGYTRDEFLQMDFTQILPAEDVQPLLEAMRQAYSLLQASERWRHQFKNGQVIDVRLTCHALEHGGKAAALVMAEDMTQRQRTEEAARDERAVAEALCDTAAALNSTLDFEQVLQRILANIGRVLPHDAADIMLIEQGVARVVGCRGYAERGLEDRVMRLRPRIKDWPGLCCAIEMGSPLLIPDTQAAATWVDAPEVHWVRSYLGVPIRVKGEVIGFLNLDSASPGFFTPVHATRLQAFADQAAIALENAQLLIDLRQRMHELEAVNKISTALRAGRNLQEMLPLLLKETLKVAGASSATLWLYEPARDELRQVAAEGFPEIAAPLKPGEGIAGQVFQSGETYVSSDFQSDPRTHEAMRARVPAGLAGAAVPIRTEQTMVGVLFVSVPPPREISATAVRILSTVAEMAGNAIHRTRLHEETERHLRELAGLHEIDRVIASTFDQHLSLNTILEQVKTQLGVDAATILVLNPYTNWLEYAGAFGFRSQAITQVRLRLGEGLAGREALERRFIHVANLPEGRELLLHSPFLVGEDFCTFFSVPLIVKGHVRGVLNAFHRTTLDPNAEWLDYLETLAGQAAIAIDNVELFSELQRSNAELTIAYDTTIEGWSRALDLRDKETEGHSQRVTEMTERLARALGLSEEEIVHVRRGALLHDIGKMGVPDSILLKPGSLTEDEWKIMRQHPEFAYALLSPIQYLHAALDIPYAHHEKWDGTGYPRGLKGEQIPLAARIFAVVDVWDALRSERLYRPAWSEEKTRKYVREQAGHHFDPAAVEAFLKMKNEENELNEFEPMRM